MIAVARPPAAPPPEKRGDPFAYLSASRLKSYLTCPLRFYFEKVLQFKKPTSPAAHLGKAVHAGLAAYHTGLWRGGDISADTITRKFSQEFSKLEEEQPVRWKAGERAESLAAGDKLIRAYLDDEFPRQRPKPIGVEVRLEADIPGIAIPLVGVADLVHVGNRLTDFKTTGVTPNPTLEAWQHELQLTAYDLLIGENTGEPVSESELVWLVKTKSPKIVRQVLPALDAVKRERFKSLADVYVRGNERGDYHPAPGQHCAWCQFRNECGKWEGSASC